MFEDKATLLTGGGRTDMIKEILQTAIFALSGRPTERRREQLKAEIQQADHNRASGSMSGFSRGSVLLQLEKAYIGDQGPQQQRRDV